MSARPQSLVVCLSALSCLVSVLAPAEADAQDLPPSTSLATFTGAMAGLSAKYSADGSRLVFHTYDQDTSSGVANVWLSKSDLTNRECLTCGNTTPGLTDTRSKGVPIFHPSGQWILFQAAKAEPHVYGLFSTPEVGQHNDIWAISPAGGTAYKIYDLPCTKSSHYALLLGRFSDDGSKLYWSESYKSPSPTNPWGLWHIRVAAFSVVNGVPTLTDITSLPDFGQPGYREMDDLIDPQTVLMSANAERKQSLQSLDIYTYNIVTGVYTNLTRSSDFDEQAHHSPYGIAYISSFGYPAPSSPFDYSAKTEYHLMDIGGHHIGSITNFNDPAFLAAVGSDGGGALRATVTNWRWSPDGSGNFVVSAHFSIADGSFRNLVVQGTLLP